MIEPTRTVLACRECGDGLLHPYRLLISPVDGRMVVCVEHNHISIREGPEQKAISVEIDYRCRVGHLTRLTILTRELVTSLEIDKCRST